MDVDKYLKKMKCENHKEVSFENLTILQSRHLQTFAFENLDTCCGKFVDLSLEKAYDKLINKSRGGFCLELNGLFGWLLGQLGYNYYFVPSYIFNPQVNKYSLLETHVFPIVTINNKKYAVDVGTTKYANDPKEIDVDKIQIHKFGVFKFKIDEECDDHFVFERSSKKHFFENKPIWQSLWKSTLKPQKYEDFLQINSVVQTGLHPTLIYKNITTINTDNSILMIIGWKYSEIVFEGNDEIRTDKIIDRNEMKMLLKEKFNIVIDEDFVVKDEPYLDIIHNPELCSKKSLFNEMA